jgi:hypothetical protein
VEIRSRHRADSSNPIVKQEKIEGKVRNGSCMPPNECGRLIAHRWQDLGSLLG